MFVSRGLTPALLSLSLAVLTPLHAETGEYQRPKQAANVKPCPNVKGAHTVSESGHTAIEVQIKMDVDVDGAPNAYGPRGKKSLDILAHAHAPASSPHPGAVVGYMTEYDGGPPTIQTKQDPMPGYYVSQTDFADPNNQRMEDPRRYVDATRIAYVVEGDAAKKAGIVMGDFATVYSCRTGKTVFAVVADSGNPSGAEGSLALVQQLGYDIRDGVNTSVDDREIVVHYFAKSNPGHFFPKSQAELDHAAQRYGLRR